MTASLQVADDWRKEAVFEILRKAEENKDCFVLSQYDVLHLDL